ELGPAKVKTLQQVYTALQRDTQMRRLLDALDQHGGAAMMQRFNQRPKEPLGCGVAAEFGEPVAIDLDDIGADQVHPRLGRMAGAEIVDGDAYVAAPHLAHQCEEDS